MLARSLGLLELIGRWLSSRNEELTANGYQGKPQLGDHGKGSQRSRRRHVEGLPVATAAVVFEPGVNHGDIGQMEPGGGCLDPVQSPSLCIDEGEGGGSMRDRERKSWQSSARAEVGPTFPWLGSPDYGQPEGVIEVSFPQALLFSRAQEAELDSLGIGLLQEFRIGRG